MTGISTHSFYERSIGNMTSLRARAETLQTQIATEQRLQRASDDPVAARQLRRLAADDTMAAVYKNNAAVAAADLGLAEDAIDQLSNLTIRAQELATQAATGTINDAQRKIIGDELEQIHTSMVAIMNTRDSSGNPLFGGAANGPAYAVAADGSASYAGSGQPAELDVGGGIVISRGLTGPDLLNYSVGGTPTDLLSVVRGLAVSVQAGAPGAASDARTALDSLTAGLDTLSAGQAVIGARQGRVELAVTLAIDQAEARAADRIRLGETDMPTAIAELQEAMTILEASQASFTKLSSLSLFDYLR